MLKTLEAALDIFFPPTCLNCGKKISPSEFLCPACQDFERMPALVCQKCAQPLKTAQGANLCSLCRRKNIYFFDRIIAPFVYKNPLSQILKLFKYYHYAYLGDFLKDKLADFILQAGFNYKEYDFITYVPMHKTKLREREYNQSKILASKLSKDLKIELKELLKARAYLKSQVTKNKRQRKEEIKDNFSALENLKDTRIILVDDVVTTGSTVSECARALKEKGAKEVVVWAIARNINENPA